MILVTGATGRLGGRVVAHLLDRVPADQVTVGVRDPRRAGDLAVRGVTVRRADFDDPTSLPTAFAGIDRLLLVSTNGPHHERFAQHQTAVNAAARAGVKHLAVTSVISNAPFHVRDLEQQTEEAIRATGISYTFLRNGLYSENYTAAVPGAAQTGTLVSAAGTGRVATAARDDLALAAAVVLTADGHEDATYELTGPRAWSFDELAAIASTVAGRPIVHRSISADEMTALRLAAGATESAVKAVVDIYRTIGDGALATVTSDLEKLIGRRATSVEESARAAFS